MNLELKLTRFGSGKLGFSAMRELTEDEIKTRLAEIMNVGHVEEAAIALGLDPAADWTDEEQTRVIAEFERRHRAKVIRDLLEEDAA